MITPMEIHNREFKKGFRGYNETEVDEFLDRIVVDYEKVLRENEKLRDKLNLNEKEVEHYRHLEKNLQDTLSVAQKTANEVLDSAKKNAKELRDNAVRDTQSIYEITRRDAQNIRDNAQLDARKHLDEAARKLSAIITEYDKIVREKTSFLLKIRTALESELAVTVQLLNAIPPTDELATIKSVMEKLVAENKVADELPEKSLPVPSTKKISQPKKVEEKPVEKIPDEPKPEPVKVDPQKESSPKVELEKPEPEKVEPPEKILDDELDDLEKTVTYKPVKKSSE